MLGQAVQRAGLAAYALLARSGVMRIPLVRRAFHAAYEIYKERVEAGPVDTLRRFVPVGSTVVDIGANVGFFTVRLADWVGPAGRVIAVEPEAENITALRKRLVDGGLASRVELHEAVAAETAGTLRLEINEVHPGDHKISTNGSGPEIKALTIDGLVGERGNVSLVKIDVQGAEMRVLEGSMRTLQQMPALFIELDRGALARFGSSPEAIVDLLERRGYGIHRLSAAGSPQAITRHEMSELLAEKTYVDILFLDARQAG